MFKIISIIILLIFISGCANNYEWGWYVLNPNLLTGYNNILFLLSGFYITIFITFISIFFSLLIGLFVSLLSFTQNKYLNFVNLSYIELVRSVPILVLLLWVYYGLPIIFEINIGPFLAGIISLSLSDSAFEAEIFRAGIQSVNKGQKDAAKSLGLNKFQEFRLIIFPLALRTILPAIGNQFVYVLKMSSLVSIIGLADLTRKANELVVSVYRPLEIYTFLVFEYLILILFVSFLVRRLEKKLKF